MLVGIKTVGIGVGVSVGRVGVAVGRGVAVMKGYGVMDGVVVGCPNDDPQAASTMLKEKQARLYVRTEKGYR